MGESQTVPDWLLEATSDAGRAYLATGDGGAHRHSKTSLSPHTRAWLDELRRVRSKAANKLEEPDRWWLTDRGYQQSSGSRIARYKAAQLRELDSSTQPLWCDLCSGVGGDLVELARLAPTISIERDAVLRWLQQQTLREFDLDSRVEWQTEDLGVADAADPPSRIAEVVGQDEAETEPVQGNWWSRVTAWHLDPDRRVDERRSSQPVFYSPSEAWIERLLLGPRPGCLKLAPAADVPSWHDLGLREWIGDSGECKQQLLWVGGHAARLEGKRVTLLDGIWGTRTLPLTADPRAFYGIGSLAEGDFLLEPHAACLAAKASGEFVEKWEAEWVSADGGYLRIPPDRLWPSSPRQPHEGAACWGAVFEIERLEKLDRKRLAQLFRDENVGRVEWKKRGLPADWLGKVQQIKLRGERAVTIIVWRGAEAIQVALARRVAPPIAPLEPNTTRP
ncbi:MAG: hypothetical protein KDA83_19485 [Planctomycetales bacterium]|nr:hypothetical protein [Planctomycetales bacterium]